MKTYINPNTTVIAFHASLMQTQTGSGQTTEPVINFNDTGTGGAGSFIPD